jgi:type IV pilus assembly protein PilM
MALPFFNVQKNKKRDQIIAIDLGGRSTKAIHLQRKGDTYTLLRYCVMDAPIFEKSISVNLLADHLKAVHSALNTKCKLVSIALGANDALVRQAELPQMPVSDLRMVLKTNSKNYLQQDLPGHVFDCHYSSADPGTKSKDAGATKNTAPKQKVLVGGVKQQLLDDILSAVRQAGLVAESVIPGVIAPFNSFEVAQPESFAKEAVALVNIGFKSSSICLCNRGDLAVTRVVNIGGDRITQGLSESMGISYAEAEGIKIGMPGEVQSNLEPLITPLGRELRASIDFFEHQQDRTVSQVYVCGGSARSEFIVRSLQTELMSPCKSWNPAANFTLALPPEQTAEIDHVSSQLTVAIGTAVAVLS